MEGTDATWVTDQLLTAVGGLPLVSAAGVLLIDPEGELSGSAMPADAARRHALLRLQSTAGPCVDACRAGRSLAIDDISRLRPRHPAFAIRSARLGLHSVRVLPLLWRGEALGALNLFGDRPGAAIADDAGYGGALAALAAGAIWHTRVLADTRLLNGRLQQALDSRVLIEQAKGMLAMRTGLSPDAAFDLIRGHARRTRRRLVDIARAVVDGTDDGSDMLTDSTPN